MDESFLLLFYKKEALPLHFYLLPTWAVTFFQKEALPFLRRPSLTPTIDVDHLLQRRPPHRPEFPHRPPDRQDGVRTRPLRQPQRRLRLFLEQQMHRGQR